MKMRKPLKITAAEKKKYALKTTSDIKILAACKKLEKMRLAANDKATIKLIKTQLLHNWRKPLERQIRKLSGKYAKG